MAQRTPVPEAWIGREIHLRYVDADAPRSLNCTIEGVSDAGVSVTAGDAASFFPWGSIVRIDLGHSRLAQGLRVR